MGGTAQGGDRRQQMTALSGRQAATVQRIVASRARVPHAILEDACQTAWLRLWTHTVVDIQAGGAVDWLVTTATREAWKRSAQRDIPVGSWAAQGGDRSAVELPEPVGDTLDPLEAAIAHEHTRELSDRLAKLTPRERAYLALNALGFTYKAIAARSGDSERTVERQILRARRKLRDQ